MRRTHPGSGLEGAPDIMLLTMAALMVAIVWLVAHAHETTLPAIELPQSDASQLGAETSASVYVTLRPAPNGTVAVFVEDDPLESGLMGLEPALAKSGAAGVTLRADREVSWAHGLEAMSVAARLGLRVSVAVEP